MGNDEHSQNVFKRARESGLDPLDYCDQMEREFRDVWARLDISFDDFIRTTEPRHRSGVDELVRRIAARGGHLRGVLRGLVLRRRARRSSRRRTSSTAAARCTGTEPDWISEKNYFFRLSTLPRRAARALRARTRSSSSPTCAATRSCVCSRAGSRTSPSAAPGSPGASRCPSTRAASSTSGSTRSSTTPSAVGLRHATPATFDALVAGRPARDRQGHHAVPRGDLAGDADERGPAAAAAGVRPRLRELQGPEDEQVARDRASIRSRRPSASAPIRCGCTW